MTTYTLKRKQKLFFLHTYTRDASGKLVSTGQSLAEGVTGKSVNEVITNTQAQAAKESQQAAQQASHQAKSAALKSNQAEINKIAGQAKTAGFEAGKVAGKNSVGFTGGLKNTWNRPGFGGKAKILAVGAALLGGGALIGKSASDK